ncbi:hypothetical protein Mkiyose1088_35990 [Mycobacterium kiyosense]|nr:MULTISPECIES: hypothetical protein [Mycobacterium]BDE17062.1 hypothetical protein MKCMC460_59220 [Mycobacterium sp. 20KCMC460]GLC22606.1 hypothetical protein SRL2020472_51770 [Mycobacterium kiyosense]GLD01733.1 hypothetical protein Mkiyose1088_35990 [Mycobacterium kiyosense]GLD08313.1 hypothetical protein Mkiyose1383_46390 [Mycobacterium kiyosense]GLD14463.1 hypothetical protein Mkiyose1384_46890 [Mycobacterium kiyosense]
MPTTTLRTEADIVAAAAAFLGFAPTNSIVAYMLHHDTTTADLVVRSAIRFDVTITVEQAAKFPATCNLRPETNHAPCSSPSATKAINGMPSPSSTPCVTRCAPPGSRCCTA